MPYSPVTHYYPRQIAPAGMFRLSFFDDLEDTAWRGGDFPTLGEAEAEALRRVSGTQGLEAHINDDMGVRWGRYRSPVRNPYECSTG